MDKFKAMGKMSIPKMYLMGAAAAIFVLTVLAGFFFWKYMALKDTDKNTAAAEAQKTSNRIISQVGQLYKLPTGEEPTVAQVQDKNKLSGQTFFAAAENGDYILVYKKSKLAMLYRESIDKLINVGPVTLDDQQTGQGTKAEAQDRKN